MRVIVEQILRFITF